MTKRTRNGKGTHEGNEPSGTLAAALTPLISGMAATRMHLVDWVQGLGVRALELVFAAEAEALAGPKGKHQAERTHHHWGRTPAELTFGGRRIQVQRPRVRSCEGEEAVLPAVAAWRERDPLTARGLAQIPAGGSRRGEARHPGGGGAGAARAAGPREAGGP